MNNYQLTLDFLFSQLPMFSRVGASAYKKDLTNTLALCEYFGNPQSKFKSIHIGGTNGKGSTTNFLGSILIESGLKVGIYTSPHLIDFRERIKIGNDYVSEEFVINFVEKAKPIIEKVQPSFFELTVVMAFEYFAQQKVDIAMIEVGLGGRLDSTNVIQPLLSIITNISLDHTNMLGNSLEEIAYEKAGIIKPNTPVVIGEYDPISFPIFTQKAKEQQAELIHDRFKITPPRRNELLRRKGTNTEQLRRGGTKNWNTPSYKLKNIKTVFNAFATLRDKELININWSEFERYFQNGIDRYAENTGFLGRWTQVNYQDKRIILECAHNEAGVLEMKKTLESETYENLIIIYGTVNDKDVSKIISILPKAKNITYLLTQANIPRALPVKDLSDLFLTNKFEKIQSVSSVSNALNHALEIATDRDLILITGSIFLVGEALSVIKKN